MHSIFLFFFSNFLPPFIFHRPLGRGPSFTFCDYTVTAFISPSFFIRFTRLKPPLRNTEIRITPQNVPKTLSLPPKKLVPPIITAAIASLPTSNPESGYAESLRPTAIIPPNDGTKLELCANKYTFVWRKSVGRWEEKMFVKIEEAIIMLNTEYLQGFSVSKETRIKDLQEVFDFLERFCMIFITPDLKEGTVILKPTQMLPLCI